MVCQKRMAFLWKNALIGHGSISLQSVCAKITSSRTIAVERRSAQKLHSSAIAFLQIFSLVAGLLPFLWHHIRTVFIEDFLFIRNYVATLTRDTLFNTLNILFNTWQLLILCTSPSVRVRPFAHVATKFTVSTMTMDYYPSEEYSPHKKLCLVLEVHNKDNLYIIT